MSIELHLFVQDSKIPSRDAWQQAIEEAGIPAVLYPTLDLRTDSGFSPTMYNGQESGFELYLDLAANYFESYPHVAEQAGNRDMCISFRWGGDFIENNAAISCGAALTRLVDGIFLHSETSEFFTAANVLEGIRPYLIEE
jgi:hypothetical protein